MTLTSPSPSSEKISLVFLGTPAFSLPALGALASHPQLHIAAVVTQPDRPAGRGQKLTPPPVKTLAEELNLPVIQTDSIKKDAELKAHLVSLAPDFLVTIAFGQILTQDVLDIPVIATVNAHASLLPEFRGANPIQQAILQGKTETGITTMLTELGVDTGPSLLKHVLAIGEDETLGSLTERLSQSAGPLLAETLVGLKQGTVKPETQDHDLATHAPKCQKEDALLNWGESAVQLHRRIRAFNPAPGAASFIQGERIKLLQASLIVEPVSTVGKPGSILSVTAEGIVVETGEGALLIRTLQPAGKREMAARDWALGAFKAVTSSSSEGAQPIACFETAVAAQPA
jgi:methionyl-tRNA formyltransferase